MPDTLTLTAAPGTHQHVWKVMHSDDDVCTDCGAISFWPSGEILELADMDESLADVARSYLAAS